MKYITTVAEELGIQKLDDWYQVTTSAINERGGKGFLFHFKNSLKNALEVLYPEHNWNPWLFAKIRR